MASRRAHGVTGSLPRRKTPPPKLRAVSRKNEERITATAAKNAVGRSPKTADYEYIPIEGDGMALSTDSGENEPGAAEKSGAVGGRRRGPDQEAA